MRIPEILSSTLRLVRFGYFTDRASLLLPDVRRRDLASETLRGFACLLLVAYHVIGNSKDSGIGSPDGSNWRLFGELLSYVRMPLFACISGFFFNTFATSWMDVGSLLARKLRRLGIPLVAVSYLFYATSCVVGTRFCSVSPWQIVVFPYAHFWFLQSTLLVMVLIAVGTFVLRSNSWLLTALALPISAILVLSGVGFSINLFSVNGALYLLPFFLLGQTLRAWSAIPYFTDNPEQRKVALVVLSAVLVFLWLIYYHAIVDRNLIPIHPGSLFGLGLSVLTCLFLFLLRFRIRLLAIIGPFSYTIYLFHPFFTSASRRLLRTIDPSIPTHLLFIIGLLSGVLFPIALHHIAIRYRLSALLLLGINTASSPHEHVGQSANPDTPKSS